MKLPTQQIINTLKRGGLVVMPTDTIYGVVARARNDQALRRLARLKKRSAEKPFIILIGSRRDLLNFKIELTPAQKKALTKLWPGSVSVILDRRAFRLPCPIWLRRLLGETGPLAAPSANPEGAPPAQTIAEAKKYFGRRVSLYVDGGKIVGRASQLIRLTPDGQATVLRV